MKTSLQQAELQGCNKLALRQWSKCIGVVITCTVPELFYLIEHLWTELKKHVWVTESQQFCQEEWAKTPAKYLTHWKTQIRHYLNYYLETTSNGNKIDVLIALENVW